MTAVHWIVLALLAFFASWIASSSLAMGAGFALLCALAFGLVTSRKTKVTARAVRELDTNFVETGGMVTVRLSVRAEGFFALRWLLVREGLAPGMTALDPSGRLSVGAGLLEDGFFFRVRCDKRGVHKIGPVELRYGDLLSLRTVDDVVPPADEIVVHPKVVDMLAAELPSGRPLGERRADPRSYEDPTMPAGSRPYQAGDALKRIHWAASARSGTLLSKVYDGSSSPLYVVILDRAQRSYGDPELFEFGCVAAASLVSTFSRTDQDVGLITDFPIAPDSGQLHLERCLKALAAVELERETLGETLWRLRRDLPWRATLIIVTPKLDEWSAAAIELLRHEGFQVAILFLGDQLMVRESLPVAATIGASFTYAYKEHQLEHVRFLRP
jgi:uncharacterized protein (DUF58 family)